MNEAIVLTEKREGVLRKKMRLALLLNLLISVLGITSLYEKFFLIDGMIAFRAFTVDGNLFTTIVSVIAVFIGIRSLVTNKESGGRSLYFLELCSAVTEAIIFIIVMIGYLPFVPDTPEILPYHMFCLHVAIPVLAVARFILFDKPLGILRPTKLLYSVIPIGVYGIGVIIAIKTSVLLSSYAPYSFLDFEHNYIWYFLFALFVIPAFGYLWAWIFYRFNVTAARLWYKKEETEQLAAHCVKAMSRFDVVNSGIAIIFSLLPILLLSFSLMTNSITSSAIQQKLMNTITCLILSENDRYLGNGSWRMESGALYKGDKYISDGTNDKDFFFGSDLVFNINIYVKASALKPELAQKYDPEDYVSILSIGERDIESIPVRGAVLDRKIVNSIFSSEEQMWNERIKLERRLTKEEEKHIEQLRNTKESFFRFCKPFGATMLSSGVGIVEAYIPSAFLTEQIKTAEFSSDIIMVLVIIAIFAVLFLVTHQWIRTLEKSVDFLKVLAKGDIPEKPLDLGNRARISGLTAELNGIREEKLRQQQKQ